MSSQTTGKSHVQQLDLSDVEHRVGKPCGGGNSGRLVQRAIYDAG